MMNERIKEMWEEATVSVWPRPGKFTAGEYDYHLEKFAELIVGECVRACEYNEAPAMLDQLTADQYALIAQGRKTAAYLVKQHFGVEE